VVNRTMTEDRIVVHIQKGIKPKSDSFFRCHGEDAHVESINSLTAATAAIERALTEARALCEEPIHRFLVQTYTWTTQT